MNNIDYFKRFVSKEVIEIKNDYFVWLYTRVSSKEQFEKNSSVDRQLEANRNYARMGNYRVAEEFGGTYESAKSDFTRKEFKRLIDKVEASRKKPYAILVYKMSRFSRSGGNAIGLVNRLVEELGVHLIEVCSGISTTTERGKAAIYESLFHAYKENLEKKEIIIPSMKAYLQNGNRFGSCPIGYNHYGPRVRNEKFLSLKQRLEINSDGELLKEAWKWKASGLYSDVQIISKLASRGLKTNHQRISNIWRNPFYCGILINKLIGEPIKGNWHPLVSWDDFIKVQQILEGNPSGYQHKKGEINRPLSRLLKCNDCSNYMVGYRNNKKDLHYYRCLRCNGVSLNAKTTPKAKRKGADDLFVDLLNKYCLPEAITPLVRLQLTKLFNYYQQDQSREDLALESQLKCLEKKLKDLKIRHGLGEIDRDTYELTVEHLSGQMQDICKELNTVAPKISNLEKLLSISLEKLKNISVIWCSSNLDNKRRIQKTLFPEGIFYNAKNHEYLTRKVNGFILITNCISEEYPLKRNRNLQKNDENSYLVAERGVEPRTSGL